MVHRDDEMQLFTYLFSGTVSALSRVTLVSSRIGFPFRIKRVDAYFPQGTNRTNQLFFFVAPDNGAPITEIVDEDNIFVARGNVTYLAGNDERRDVLHEVEYQRSGMYLKVHANNTDGVEHTIDATITIARIRLED